MLTYYCSLTLLLLYQCLGALSYGILVRDQADRDAEGIWPPKSLFPREDILPESFSWRSIPEVGNLLTPGGNQHIPKYCGACYAFGSFHTLQDRIKVARHLMNIHKNSNPPHHLAPDYIGSIQVLLNCIDSACSGGSVAGAWGFVRDFKGGGIPTASCMEYEASDAFTCDPINICRNCMGSAQFTDATPDYTCWAVPHDGPAEVQCFGQHQCHVEPYPRLGVLEFGKLPPLDEAAIRREVAARGPVACAVDAYPMLSTTHGEILEDDPELAVAKLLPHAHLNSKNGTDHIIEVVGWGVDRDSNVPYWEVRNSWGEYWADGGFVKVRRGRNDLLIETDCHWVIPSGWGSPGVNWQYYNEEKVNRGAYEIVTGTEFLVEKSSPGPSGTSPRWSPQLLVFLFCIGCFGSLCNFWFLWKTPTPPPNPVIEMNSSRNISFQTNTCTQYSSI